MKKLVFTLLIVNFILICRAGNIFMESFEYANTDMTAPNGWVCDDESWLCGYLEKDHNRIAHTGDWYAFTNANDSWMFMDSFISTDLKYRFSFWGISDGSYEVEFWGGNEASENGMTQLFFTVTVNSGKYEKFSEYIETISSNFQYFGIHAVAASGAHHLTIDDINVDMVNRYDLDVTPVTVDTVMYPGTQFVFSYTVQNTGYESLHVYMNGYSDFFTDIQFTEDGFNYSSFPTEPGQTVHCTCTATLLPGIEPGTTCWIDIRFTVSCDCITRMATLWAKPLGIVEDFPVDQSFDKADFMKDGWIVMSDGSKRWEWTDERDGMLRFRSSGTDESSVLYSPKMRLNETDNSLNITLFRSDEAPDKEDRVNVYYNTEFSLEGATLLETIHRSANLSPAITEKGWVEHIITFDCPNPEGFIIVEAVGDFGEDILLDNLTISNSPLLMIGENNLTIGIYPNPSKGQVTIEGTGTITITNALGQLVLRKNITDKETIELPRGVYFVKINESKTQKVIIE